ncbi:MULTISPECIES: hypothetical protein [Bacillus cereus group]|uniref:hypothetical protein n=1 Tax=Bacillus cereus group TaxID=86661 RepID=UPI00080F6644|nr:MULTISPECIES: hypothetical protein [Bacillus cereus group]ANV70803.1 hypothetical protein BCM43_09915 [Bacillus thuringiensis]MBJ7963019.1 hypothetical protein [Bacillus cereus]MBJ7998450.1 hypothetical protein [Bacillus cereus]HDR4459991.1 hypothetical protein [Bacillus cereus]
MEFIKNTILNSGPALVTLVTCIASLLYFLGNKFIKIKSLTHIDKLFLDKSTNKSLQVWQFIIAVVYALFVYNLLAHTFGSNFPNSFDYDNSNSLHKTYFWSAWLFIISLISLIVSRFLIKKFKHHNSFVRIVCILILLNLITSVIFYFFFYYEFVLKSINLSSILIINTFPVILMYFYTITLTKITKEFPTSYLINLVSEDIFRSEKIIHGYMLDEKRTVCFLEKQSQEEVFYVCDFSAKVYQKYTLIP